MPPPFRSTAYSLSDSSFMGMSILSSLWKSLEGGPVVYSVWTSSDSLSELSGAW